jgi:hypothetical protein
MPLTNPLSKELVKNSNDNDNSNIETMMTKINKLTTRMCTIDIDDKKTNARQGRVPSTSTESCHKL